MIWRPLNDREWHSFFAILLHKTLSGRMVWMQFAERRWNPEFSDYLISASNGHWEYRLPRAVR